MAIVNTAFKVGDEHESEGDVLGCNGNVVHMKTVAVTVNHITVDEVTLEDVPLDDVVNGNVTAISSETRTITESNENSDKAVESSNEPEEPLSCFERFRILLYHRRGLLFAVLGAFCFSIEDTLMDILAQTLDVFQISCMVSSITVAFSAVALVGGKITPPTKKLEYFLLLVTGILLSLGLPTALLSLKYMELGAAIAIIYTMPIFTGVFGWMILKEALRIIDLFFALISFGGVLLIAQPAFLFGESGNEEDEEENLFLGTILGLASAVTFALMVVISRKQTDMGLHLFVLMFFNGVVTCFVNAIVCTFTDAWKMPSGVEWGEIIGFGVIDFAAQIALILAVMSEVAFLVSIATTSEVIFSFLWQIIIFRIIPDWQTGVGAVLIISSCVGLALKQSKVNTPESDEKKVEEGGVDNVSAICAEEDEVSVKNEEASGKNDANHVQETDTNVNFPT